VFSIRMAQAIRNALRPDRRGTDTLVHVFAGPFASLEEHLVDQIQPKKVSADCFSGGSDWYFYVFVGE